MDNPSKSPFEKRDLKQKIRSANWRKSGYLGCLLALPVVLYLIPLRWITDGGPTICLFKNITGHDCYGCGITRALFSLVHFEFAAAWAYNRLVVVVAPLLLYLYVKEILKTKTRL